MKRIITLAAVILAVSCGQNKPQKALVLYYSQNGATKTVAEAIAQALNADTEEIVAVNPYDGDFGATIARSQEERAQGILPEIEPTKANLKDYDVIFLGYPMINAKAEKVCVREVEGGKEYFFTARDLPRPDANPDAPAHGTIKVYVLALDGETPVFTQVLR